MKLLSISGLLVGMLVLAAPVSAEEPTWGESSRPSIKQQLSGLKEQQYQNALEWQRKHVKQNWAQKLTGTYSTERVDETPQNNANQSNLANIRRQGQKSSNLAAPTLIGPRGGGEFKPLSRDFNTNHTLKKESKLGLNLGTSSGSSLHVDKQNLKKETQGFGTGPGLGKAPGFSQSYGQQEVDPTLD